MKPYRIKHKLTGLYFQPSQNGNNLSEKGKVYLTRICPLIINRGTDYISVRIKQNSMIFKKYHSILGLKEKEEYLSDHTLRIPKSEFEIELLEEENK